MSAINNVTNGGSQYNFGKLNDIDAFKNKTYALEDVRGEHVELKGVTVKELTPEEAKLAENQELNQDVFVRSDTIDITGRGFKSDSYFKRMVFDLFAYYGKKFNNLDYNYEKGSLDNHYCCVKMRHEMEEDLFGEDDIAKIAAEVGRDIDYQYKSGELDEEEYNKANAEFENGTKAWIDKFYNIKASIRQDKEWTKLRMSHPVECALGLLKRTPRDIELERIRLKNLMMKENSAVFNSFFAKIRKR